MGKFESVEQYVDAQPGAMAEVARCLVRAIDATGLLGSRAVWYGHPVWSIGPAPANGPVVYIKAYSKHVTLGFWSADGISHAAGAITIGGGSMGSVKVSTVAAADTLPVAKWVRQARAAVNASVNQQA
jgi:hypothetical protein